MLQTRVQQDEIDWEAVYWEQMPRIYNFFRYRVADEALAEDLTATTFEKAWKAREGYRRDLSAFSTWLFTIARNTAADYFRQPRTEVPLDAAPEMAVFGGRPVEEAVQHEGDLLRLALLLTDLNAREREIIALKYGAELTNRAIADLLRISESNVGTILHRVVQRLRTQWEEARIDEP
ncbi:MAG: sigma-70 family RNA polymerase sigma factor [bacterium]|nr:sigma-70 family RNA polymerase sigma factor [bacterium]